MILHKTISKGAGRSMISEEFSQRCFGPLQAENPRVTPVYVCLSAAVFPKGECPVMIGRDTPNTRLYE